MSNMSNSTSTPRSKSEAIKRLHSKNIKMGKELGILRIVSCALVLAIIILSVCAISWSSKINSVMSDLNMYKEAYSNESKLVETLREELENLKGSSVDDTVPPIEDTMPSTEVTEPLENTTPSSEATEPEETENNATVIPMKYDNIPLDYDLKVYIYTCAIQSDIPPEIMFSIAWRESTFNPDLVSTTNDHGLFQINECNFEWLANEFGYSDEDFEKKIYDPYVNTDCSIFILTNFRDKYKNENWHHVLMRYNLGPNGADKQFEKGNYSTKYSRAIIEYAQENFELESINFG